MSIMIWTTSRKRRVTCGTIETAKIVPSQLSRIGGVLRATLDTPQLRKNDDINQGAEMEDFSTPPTTTMPSSVTTATVLDILNGTAQSCIQGVVEPLQGTTTGTTAAVESEEMDLLSSRGHGTTMDSERETTVISSNQDSDDLNGKAETVLRHKIIVRDNNGSENGVRYTTLIYTTIQNVVLNNKRVMGHELQRRDAADPS